MNTWDHSNWRKVGTGGLLYAYRKQHEEDCRLCSTSELKVGHGHRRDGPINKDGKASQYYTTKTRLMKALAYSTSYQYYLVVSTCIDL